MRYRAFNTVVFADLIESEYPFKWYESYPCVSEEIRHAINERIIEHYYFREIGITPVARFDFIMSRKMKEIMPKYNKLIELDQVDFNPLYNIDITETYESDDSSSDISTQNDTPEDSMTEDDIVNSKYMSAYTKNKSDNKNSYTRTTKGSSAGLPFSKAIQQARSIVKNWETEILKEVSQCFINIY